MPTIPSGTKFIGISPDVPTPENRSSLSNSYQETYTIDDIVAEASAADTNIYNTDGTLDGNRTVDLDGNTIEFNNGNVGINVTPSVPLHVMGTAIPSTNENLAYFQVTDGAGAYFAIQNGSTADGSFQPKIVGRQASSSNATAVTYAGVIDSTQDSGTTPVVGFQAHLHTLVAVATRPLFQFRNWATNIMTILANGNVGIGTVTPSEKLEVNGKTKTTTFQMTTSPTAGYVLTSDASGNGSWSAASGGLTKFTEAENTSAPNGTVYVDSLTAASSSTNADAAFVPKGTGALLGAVPNNLTSGGNKRGEYAVDWQLLRNVNTQVASGNRSAILGGYNNIASGTYSLSFGNTSSATNDYSIAIGQTAVSSGNNSISLGYANTASNTGATALGYGNTANAAASFSAGDSNIASGSRCVAIGQSSTASGDVAVALGRSCTSSGARSFTTGYLNTASGQGSQAMGEECTAAASYAMATGNQANTSTILGRQSHAISSGFQQSNWLLRRNTSGNTLTYLTTDGTDEFTGGATNMFLLVNNQAMRFKGTIIGKQSGSANVASWDVDGLVVRTTSAANTTLVVSNVTVVSNSPAWGTPTLTANTTRGGISISVTGASATNINWTCYLETTEVIYA